MPRFKYLTGFIFCGILIFFAQGCRAPKISSPSGDVTIESGDSISFEAEFHPDAIYKWTFGGGAEDAYGQNPTVRFDRAGVYDISLTVVFNDLDSGFALLKVTVNDPSSEAYTLTLDGYTATRAPVDSMMLIWVVEKNGSVVLRRNAKNEMEFTYFDNSTGNYKIWLERFYNGAYQIASNQATYSVP